MVVEIVLKIENPFIRKSRNLMLINRNTVQFLRNDEGEEYIGRDVEYRMRRSGFLRVIRKRYSPESNARTELLNWTLLKAARTMLIDPSYRAKKKKNLGLRRSILPVL